MLKTDVVIIGAGAVGCSVARELSKHEIDVIVVDKNEDIGGDASKSNSAIIHTGYDATPDTLESQLVVAANPMYEQITKDLDVPYAKIGAILPAFTEEQFAQLPAIKEKAFRNRVYDVEFKTGAELLEMEPNLNPEVLGGLYIPREGIIDPFILVQAYAENAYANGVKFRLKTKVTGIRTENGAIRGVETTAGDIECRYVINCAGLYCDEIAAMVGKAEYRVVARKGEFFILDKNTNCKVNHIVLPIPTKITKGKLMCPTIHGNMLVGPTVNQHMQTSAPAVFACGHPVRAVAWPMRCFAICVITFAALLRKKAPLMPFASPCTVPPAPRARTMPAERCWNCCVAAWVRRFLSRPPSTCMPTLPGRCWQTRILSAAIRPIPTWTSMKPGIARRNSA